MWRSNHRWNYAFFEEVETFKDIGYPIAEIYEDGSFMITKHENTGGLISTGTVTAQLLYEISSVTMLIQMSSDTLILYHWKISVMTKSW